MTEWFSCTRIFTVTDWLGDIGLMAVNNSWLETIYASRMDFYCCWSSYFSSDLYNFLMFSKHLCSYIELLLNDWSTPIVTICCFSRSDQNNPLIMTHFCSNEWISIIKSITLVNKRYLEHCEALLVSSYIWKERYYFMGVGSFWPGLWHMSLCWHCRESYPQKYGYLVQWHCDHCFGSFKQLGTVITQPNVGTWCSDNVAVFSGSLKQLGIVVTQKNLGTWYSDAIIVYSGNFKQLKIFITQQNLFSWCSDTVIVFMGVSNDSELS